MELATIILKLQGQTQNTVVKHDVTPAQLAILATMHGEDCVQALNVTGVSKRDAHAEMNRLKNIFVTEYAAKTLNQIFPGIHPQLPTTFRAMGYDPAMLHDANLTPKEAGTPTQAVRSNVIPESQLGARIADNIRAAAAQRQLEEGGPSKVNTHELAGALDNTGGNLDDGNGDDEEELEFSDDPIDQEIARERQLQLPPKPAA